MDIRIVWKSEDGWQPFHVEDIEAYPVQHMIDLFSVKIPVVACIGGSYYVNNERLLRDYQRSGKQVKLFQEIPAEMRGELIGGML